jgi:arylsulfatase
LPSPNVIVIQVDQMRYDALGCCGNPFAITPNLDRLAAQGARFDRHFAANPVCMPSRASLMTGRYPSGHGLWHNGVALPRQSYVTFDREASGVAERQYEGQIISHVPTMPDTFAEAGYDTRAIGKLHLTPTGADPAYGYEESRARWRSGEMKDWHGPYYGFQHVELAVGHGERTIGHYRHWLEERFPQVIDAIDSGQARDNREFRDLPDLYPSPIPVEAHHSTWIAERATSFLTNRNPEQPFLLYLGFPDPHHPFTPPRELADRFSNRPVVEPAPERDNTPSVPAAVSELHHAGNGRLSTRRLPAEAVTRVRQYTDAMVHLIDTAVGTILDTLNALGLSQDTIVAFTSDHGDWLGDHGLMLKDTICTKSLVHVPFILRWPGTDLPATVATPMSNVDVLPTLCDLAGIRLPDDVQGASIIPDLLAPERRVALTYGYQHTIANHNFSIFDERYRLTLYPHTRETELYDHANDPREMTNLAHEPAHASTVDLLSSQLLNAHLLHDTPAAGRIARF